MTKETLPPSRTADQFVIRLPGGMRDKIAEAAKANGRSMNAEIVARLQRSLDDAPGYSTSGTGTVNVDIQELAVLVADVLKGKQADPPAPLPPKNIRRTPAKK